MRTPVGLWTVVTGVVVASLLATAGDSNTDGYPDPAPEPSESVALPHIEADPPDNGPSALDDMRHPDFPAPLIDPVVVTYCPLCNSGVAFDRRVGDTVLDFGTSGQLYESNLVMYDRQTESLWPQLTGTASIGVATGTRLDAIPMGTVAWNEFAAADPDAWVLSRDTGFDRDYGSNPYTGHDDADGESLFGSSSDDRLPPMERVVGIGDGDGAVAITRTAMADADTYPVIVDGEDLVVWHTGGQTSALDTGDVADGKLLHFETSPDGFTDTQTGSTWNIVGETTDGPLRGTRLAAHPHLDTFWFAWVAFQPDTKVPGEP